MNPISVVPTVIDLGCIPFNDALKIQTDYAKRQREGSEPPRLLLVEHPPTITLGKRASENEIKVSKEALRQSGVTVAKIDRGGLATAHNPGQLVCYPIYNLRLGCRFLSTLIEIYGIEGGLAAYNGGEKLAALWLANNKAKGIL